MPTNSVSGVSAADLSGTALKPTGSSVDAFRNADFLKIILAEITSQDPMSPMDTSKMVESLRQVQNLANTTYQKFRDDLRWAQDLVGKTVNVTQVGVTEPERQRLVNSGLKPDVGFSNLDGKIESFRSVNSAVWVSIDGKDYPMENVRQVRTVSHDPDALAQASNRLLGMRIKYWSTDPSKTSEGVVSSVGYDPLGKIQLGVGGEYVQYDRMLAITVPASTTTNPAF